MEMDRERIKKRLNLETEGSKRGENNQPATDTEGLDDIEQKIVATIDSEKDLSHEKLTNHLKNYGDRISSLGLEGLITVAAAIGDAAAADFRTQARDGAEMLFQSRRHVILIDDEIKEFKRENGLRRMAHYPRSYTLRGAIIMVLLFVEIVLNGTFLARGHEMGPTGGVAEALAIAILNIGGGLWVGWKAAPNVMHMSPARKMAGVTLTLSCFALAIGFNLFVAHYRDALGGDLPERASALARVWSDPFAVTSPQSWFLFAMGFGFSLIAAIDGWTMDDHYPGYGKLTRKQNELIEDYVGKKRELMDKLERTRDRALDALASAGRKIDRRRREYHRIVQSRKDLQEAFANHLDDLEYCARYLLASYRRANEGARKSRAPAHFEKRWKIGRPHAALDGAESGQTMNMVANVEKALEELPRQRRRIRADYEAAASEFLNIEQLTPDALRDGAIDRKEA